MLDLVREVVAPLPPDARRDALRAQVLASARAQGVLHVAEPRRGRRSIVAAVGATLAVAAGVWLVLARDAAPAVHSHGSVRALGDATKFQTTTRSPDEVVMLYDGSIEITVAPLHAGERFRVLVGRDEIEVRGTQFIATARDGMLVDVTVSHGVVEVRPQFGAMAVLTSGEVWRGPVAELARPAPAANPPPPPAALDPVEALPRTAEASRPRPKAPKAVAPRPPVEVAPPEKPRSPDATAEVLPQERAYIDGWTAMREARFDEAAKLFLRVQLLDPDGTLAEDATYYYAVALARAKSEQAVGAFREMLARYPQGSRAGRANAMLGWLLVDAKQAAEAERRFRAALADPDDDVRESAEAGLAALAAARK